jgi:hypothetical protein
MRTRWAGHVANMGKMRNGYKILYGELERIISMTYPFTGACIESDLKEIGCDSAD